MTHNAPQDCPTKTCLRCHKPQPNTNKYFVESLDDKSQLTDVCLTCSKRKKKNLREKLNKHATNLAAKLEQFSLEYMQNSCINDPNNLPHSAELVESIYRAFGGVDGFSKILAMHFWQADPGKAQRTRVLQAVIALTTQNVDQGGAKKPLDLWTEEEIEAEYQKRLEHEAARIPLRISNVG